MQDPCGRWNKSAQTGFVTTAYSLHALSRLYPVSVVKQIDNQAYHPSGGNESLVATLAQVRALSHSDNPALVDLMIQASSHRALVPGPHWLGGIYSKRRG
jgi:hypothetical protein